MTDTDWAADIFEGFEAMTVPLPTEDDGELVFTIVRKRLEQRTNQCVIYLHGYSDYFFQDHLADAYLSRGIDFYAIDLRRCGRSTRPGNRRNYFGDVRVLGTELDHAVQVAMEDDGHTSLILHGHSMGGAVASIYAAGGAQSKRIDLLALNSPWLDVKLPLVQRLLWWFTKHFGHRFPHKEIPARMSNYVASIHEDLRGQWAFDFAWKPAAGEVVYPGWTRAIARAHDEIHSGIGLEIPILVQHSDRSTSSDEWHDDLLISDGILDVAQISHRAQNLGSDVTVQVIERGMHDLVLSQDGPRQQMLDELFSWIESRS